MRLNKPLKIEQSHSHLENSQSQEKHNAQGNEPSQACPLDQKANHQVHLQLLPHFEQMDHLLENYNELENELENVTY